MEARGVNCDTVSLFFELLHDIRDNLIFCCIVPYTDGSITRACCHNLFLEAHIHAEDRMRVEGANEIVIVLVV